MCEIDFIPPENVFIFCQHSDTYQHLCAHVWFKGLPNSKGSFVLFWLYYISLESDHHYAFVEILTMQECAFW